MSHKALAGEKDSGAGASRKGSNAGGRAEGDTVKRLEEIQKELDSNQKLLEEALQNEETNNVKANEVLLQKINAGIQQVFALVSAPEPGPAAAKKAP